MYICWSWNKIKKWSQFQLFRETIFVYSETYKKIHLQTVGKTQFLDGGVDGRPMYNK